MIIEYSGAILNIEKILYGMVTEYKNVEGYTRYKFSVYLEGGKSVEWGNYKNRDDAQERYNDFFQTLQKHQFVIQEQSL